VCPGLPGLGRGTRVISSAEPLDRRQERLAPHSSSFNTGPVAFFESRIPNTVSTRATSTHSPPFEPLTLDFRQASSTQLLFSPPLNWTCGTRPQAKSGRVLDRLTSLNLRSMIPREASALAASTWSGNLGRAVSAMNHRRPVQRQIRTPTTQQELAATPGSRVLHARSKTSTTPRWPSTTRVYTTMSTRPSPRCGRPSGRSRGRMDYAHDGPTTT